MVLNNTRPWLQLHCRSKIGTMFMNRTETCSFSNQNFKSFEIIGTLKCVCVCDCCVCVIHLKVGIVSSIDSPTAGFTQKLFRPTKTVWAGQNWTFSCTGRMGFYHSFCQV